MKKMLRATKSMKYGTRRLLPGDEFEASGRDAHILLGLRNSKVEAVEKRPTSTRTVISGQAPKAAPNETTFTPSGTFRITEPNYSRGQDDVGTKSDLDHLRKQAEALGIPIDGRWGPHRLRTEISAKQRMAG